MSSDERDAREEPGSKKRQLEVSAAEFDEFLRWKKRKPDQGTGNPQRSNDRPGGKERQLHNQIGQLVGILRQQARQPQSGNQAAAQSTTSIIQRPASSSMELALLQELILKMDQLQLQVQLLRQSLTQGPVTYRQSYSSYFSCADWAGQAPPTVHSGEVAPPIRLLPPHGGTCLHPRPAPSSVTPPPRPTAPQGLSIWTPWGVNPGPAR